jgi:hypothetical protein
LRHYVQVDKRLRTYDVFDPFQNGGNI